MAWPDFFFSPRAAVLGNRRPHSLRSSLLVLRPETPIPAGGIFRPRLRVRLEMSISHAHANLKIAPPTKLLAQRVEETSPLGVEFGLAGTCAPGEGTCGGGRG